MASTRTQSVEPLSSETAKPERIRLDFLDGMRGLAALYVLFCHVYVALKWWSHGAEASPRLMKVLQVFDYGHCAVVVFIVMSGYCLMLPIAQATDGQLRGGFGAYIKRRARRILPPYFAALAISLLMIFALDRAGLMGGELQAIVKSAFTPGSLVSHLLVVHNLNPTWSHTIDPPMWSVATEWQIYFLFPALLLPLWRRFGNAAPIIAGFAFGYALLLLSRTSLNAASPWYLGLFAYGMIGAVLNFSQVPHIRAFRERVPWTTLAGILLLGLLAFGLIFKGWYTKHRWLLDPFVGLAAITMIISFTQTLQSRAETSRPLLLYLLESRVAVTLGTFSYSLYLIHYPLLQALHILLVGQGASFSKGALLILVVITPLTFALSYLFHLAFERRFMTVPKRANK